MNKKILRSKESEIAKAGRLLFDALFGETEEFEQNLAREIDRDGAIHVEGEGFVRCSDCALEKAVPAGADLRIVERQGWRFTDGAWRCPFCVRRANTKGQSP